MISKTNRNIVDIVLDIMDRGPRPMKNLRATEKNRNCVDQFYDAHQAEYEERGKLNKDDVERVNQHNLTYPRLGVELDKRKSLSKVKTDQQRDDSSKRPHSDIECAACNRLRRSSPLRKNTLRPKYKQRKMKSKTRSRDIKSRVRKNRYRNQKRITSRLLKTISVNKMTKCRCCYVRVKHKRVGNDMSAILNLEPKNSKKNYDMNKDRMGSSSRIVNDRPKERMNSREWTDNLLSNERKNDLKSEEGRSEQNSIKTLKNPDTSVASISSYNTYASLDHEPMVNMEL